MSPQWKVYFLQIKCHSIMSPQWKVDFLQIKRHSIMSPQWKVDFLQIRLWLILFSLDHATFTGTPCDMDFDVYCFLYI
jgi:hypothetical protein